MALADKLAVAWAGTTPSSKLGVRGFEQQATGSPRRKKEMSQNSHDKHDSSASAHYAHVVPLPVLLAVFIALMLLTFLTVAATWFDLGRWNVWIALIIATIKAALVVLYFMHLRYDHPFNAVVFLSALLTLLLFIALALLDSTTYQPDIRALQETMRNAGS